MLTTYELRQRSYLLKIARAMTSNLDLPSLLRLTLSAAAEMVQGEIGLIALSQPADSFRIEAYYGIASRMLPLFAPLLTDISRSANPLERTLTIPDLTLKLHVVSSATGLILRQVVALPLQVNQDLLGLIYIFRSGSAAFSANDRQVLQDFADQAAIAVRNARLYQAVNDERRRLDTIIQNSADGVMILTPERKIEVINRTLATMTGWSPEAAQGLPCYQVLVLENVRGADLCQDMGAGFDLAGRDSMTAEGDLVRPGGSRITVGVTYTPLFAEGGRLQQIIVNVVDITRFREAEEMKNTFVSVITHELKTPVSLIKGYASTLRRDDAQWDSATMRESLTVIEEEADRLNALVDNLLDASRVQAGVLQLELGDVDLPGLAARLVEGFKLQTKRHTFQLDFPTNFPPAWGDSERLRQVLNNLISNAIKYSPDGGMIRIGGWQDLQRQMLTIYVADQGIGIPAPEQERLFQRFYRVDSSLRRKTQGAGLGLFLCKAIIEAHNGRIWVRSEPGKGSTFFITLPVYTGSGGQSEDDQP